MSLRWCHPCRDVQNDGRNYSDVAFWHRKYPKLFGPEAVETYLRHANEIIKGEQDLACLQLREIVGVTSATPRPFLEPYIQRLCHPDLKPADPTPPAPPVATFKHLFATLRDVRAAQDVVTDLLSTQYRAICATETMKVFENTGELFRFMESFNEDAYMRAQPTTDDIVCDMDVMQSWLSALEGMQKVAHHGLLVFDFSGLRSEVLAVVSRAERAFLRLMREWLYDRCMSLEVRSCCHSSKKRRLCGSDT
jgi:hypothetical protein